MEILLLAIVFAFITGVSATIKYGWAEQFRNFVYDKPNWEEVMYIYSKKEKPIIDRENKTRPKYWSRQVFIVTASNEIHTGYYSYQTNLWYSNSVGVLHESEQFKWMYAPKHFSFTKKEIQEVAYQL